MKKFVVLIAVIISFLHCTNNKPLPNAYELLDQENYVELGPPVSLRPTRVASYWKHRPAGTKTDLLLGTGKDSQSFIIFQCRNLIKVDSSASLVSAELAIRSSFYMGEASPFAVTAHRVVDEWNESSVLWDDVKNSYLADPIESFEFTPADTTWHKIPFTNLAFMDEWIKDSYASTQEIKGLIIKFDQAAGGSILYSSEATVYPPYFQIVTKNSASELDTTFSYLSHDAGLAQNESGVEEETLEESPVTLKVGNGTGFKSLLHFDISEIPKEATIHKALLTFNIDHSEIFVPTDSVGGTFSVAAHAIVSDSSWEPSSIAVDSSLSAAVDVVDSSNDTFAFDSASPIQNMTLIVQRWVSEVTDNNGLLVYPYYQNSDFQEMSFKSGVADTAIAPTLDITYSLPPAHRFARP